MSESVQSARRAELFLVDILASAFKASYAVRKIADSKEFVADFIVFDAVLRELQVIGEAVSKLIQRGILDDDLRIIVDFRNRITHEYFGIDHDIVWSVVQQELPLLVETINKIISSQTEAGVILEALESAVYDHVKVQQQAVVEYLTGYLKQMQMK